MHITLRNEDTGKVEGVICIDRTSQSCTVLQADAGRLDDLVRLALAMKVTRVLATVPPTAVKELESYGWIKAADLVLMVKEGSNGTKST
jgi:hypothetical protein